MFIHLKRNKDEKIVGENERKNENVRVRERKREVGVNDKGKCWHWKEVEKRKPLKVYLRNRVGVRREKR